MRPMVVTTARAGYGYLGPFLHQLTLPRHTQPTCGCGRGPCSVRDDSVCGVLARPLVVVRHERGDRARNRPDSLAQTGRVGCRDTGLREQEARQERSRRRRQEGADDAAPDCPARAPRSASRRWIIPQTNTLNPILREHALPEPESLASKLDGWRSRRASVLYVIEFGRVVGALALGDRVRPQSHAAVSPSVPRA
jgi:hypothetical protein